ALLGAVAIGVVVFVMQQAKEVARQVEQAVAATPPPAAAQAPQDSAEGEKEAAPVPELDPEAAAAQEALAKLRESLGQEIPGFEAMLEEQLQGLPGGAGGAAGAATPEQLEEAKQVEVVS